MDKRRRIQLQQIVHPFEDTLTLRMMFFEGMLRISCNREVKRGSFRIYSPLPKWHEVGRGEFSEQDMMLAIRLQQGMIVLLEVNGSEGVYAVGHDQIYFLSGALRAVGVAQL